MMIFFKFRAFAKYNWKNFHIPSGILKLSYTELIITLLVILSKLSNFKNVVIPILTTKLDNFNY